MEMRAACLAIAAAVLAVTTVTSAAAGRIGTFLDVRVDDMPPGSIKVLRTNDAPIIIVRTTPEMLADLNAQTAHTWSLRPIEAPAFFVFSPSSAARCAVVHEPSGTARYTPGRVWPGGFYDPCRFGEWDYAGRAVKQFEDQSEAMRRPDLEPIAFERKGDSILRVAL